MYIQRPSPEKPHPRVPSGHEFGEPQFVALRGGNGHILAQGIVSVPSPAYGHPILHTQGPLSLRFGLNRDLSAPQEVSPKDPVPGVDRNQAERGCLRAPGATASEAVKCE